MERLARPPDPTASQSFWRTQTKQFRFLANLLLEHGRFNYRRTATVVKYVFYKNALLVLPQFFFGIYSAFSGQNFYSDVYYQLCKSKR